MSEDELPLMTSDLLIEGRVAVEFPTWVFCKYEAKFATLTEAYLFT